MDPSVIRCLQVPRTSADDEEALFDNRIWIPDPQLGYRLCSVLDEGLTDVLVGFRDDQGFFEKKRVEKKDCHPPSRNVSSEDLCQLTEPNTATVLDALHRRYSHGVIHTYCGLFCVVVNPWKQVPIYSPEVMDSYRTSIGNSAPHIFSVAQQAYDGILRSTRNQSILITGESGAGKTENTKKIIDFIIHSCGSSKETAMGNDVITTGQLLEAFGNARTTHNNNSSRFGKFIKIDFNNQAKLQSAQIECYLLEKSRVVSQNEGERNFHIFYQLFSKKLPFDLRNRLQLEGSPELYKFLNQGDACQTPDINDTEQAWITYNAMQRLGLTEDEIEQVYEMVAACLMIGEIRFGERAGMDLSFVEGQEEVDQVANLLDLKPTRIIDALTSPTIRVGDKLIRKNQNLKKTQFSASAMTKVIYERLFNYLLSKCNDAIRQKTEDIEKDDDTRFIGVLDIAGFEIMQKNSFEQFCINFTNEKLQQFFNHFMFVKEQAEYEEEHIQWNHMNFANDLQPTIDLIEKPMGLLALLEEECVMPSGSDTSLLEKFCANSNTNVFSKAKLSKKNKHISHFSLKHYAGTVDYNITSWIEKNRDVVETSVLALLSESGQPLVHKLFPKMSTDASKNRRGTMCQASVSHIYKNQLQSLLDCLNLSSAHFIRCIVPNYERVPGKIDGPLVLHQLRCNGVLEGIRICRKGYPSRILFAEFIQRYRILGGTDFKLTGKQGCINLLDHLNLDKERYQIGTSKVFCKVGVISELESMRRDWMNDVITQLQAHIRSYLGEKDVHRKTKLIAATDVIQNNVRVFANLSNWPWFRLMYLVRPMIPKDREMLRIAELEKMIQKLEKTLADTEAKNDQLTQILANKEIEWLKQIDELRKEKEAMENRLRKKLEETTDDYQRKLEEAEKENRELQKSMKIAIADALEEYKTKSSKAEEEQQRLKRESEQEQRKLQSQVEAALKKSLDLQGRLDKADKEKANEMKKLKCDMEQNEEVFSLLEKKYNEQHQNVLKLNDKLREYERQIEEEKMTNDDLRKEIKRLQDALDREKGEKDLLQASHDELEARLQELEARYQNLLDENGQLKLMLATQENETEDSKSRNKRQTDTIMDLQKLIEELNAKTARHDKEMLEEKNKRRKVEKDRDRLEEELQYMKDHHEKLKKKYEQLKETTRQRDNTIKILERKLEDKEAIMQDCVKDLKDNHKAKMGELEGKIDDYKRRNSKLESENSLQKMKLDSTFDRESSVDSDYGISSLGRSCTSSRLSTLGRQYSLTSCSSFSSMRTLNRRQTESDLSSSLYLPRRRDSALDLSPSYTPLQKTSSNSNIEKDRKISELERQMQTMSTDLNLLKRELEVYKTSLSSLEAEKERMVHVNRSQAAEMDNLKRQADRSEKNADSLAMRLKKALEDAEMWKKKHGCLIEETKNDILDERKKANERLESVRNEYEQRQSRYQKMESSREDIQDELNRCKSELDRAIMTIQELESNVHSQEFLGDSIETTYRNLLSEFESLKDENGMLKSRIRRQQKQIELLTQQDSTNDMMNHMNSKVSAYD